MLVLHVWTRFLDSSAGKTTTVREIGKLEREAEGTRYIFTVVDTPGYGDYIDNNKSFAPIEDYINNMYQDYRALQVSLDHSELDRVMNDGRIHCCFYFIAPHRIKPIDVEFMTRLQKQVPIVPILAKADTMTVDERKRHLMR